MSARAAHERALLTTLIGLLAWSLLAVAIVGVGVLCENQAERRSRKMVGSRLWWNALTSGPAAESSRSGSHLHVSVSNSWSGGDGEQDKIPAMGDPAHMIQVGRERRVSTGEGQRRMALQ